LVSCKAKVSGLRHIGDALKGSRKVAVRVPERGDAVDLGLDQVMPMSDGFPSGPGVGHLLGQWRTLGGERNRFETEPLGQASPHPAPTEDIAINDVKGLVPRRRPQCSPFQMLCQQSGIRHIGKTIPLLGIARKHERVPRFPAVSTVDTERCTHVHDIGFGVADHGVRAMHAPGKTVLFCGDENLVFEIVVEVGDIEARE
jgi:hypothetical protein